MKVALAFIAVVAGVAACNGNVSGPDPTAPLRQAKERIARAQISTMSSALEAYEVANGEYPATLTGALETPEPDPWGTQWVYAFPGRKGGRPYDLYSAGPDKTPNTADDVR